MQTQVVWFKRDLRVDDHAPLLAAARAQTMLALYVMEPSMILAEDCSGRHLGLIDEALLELDAQLRARGSRLLRCYAEVVSVLQLLWERVPFTHLWSHEETGNGISYARDIAVAAWCASQGVQWQECPQNGVIRGLKSRDRWAARWAERLAHAPQPAPMQLPPPPPLRMPSALLTPPVWYHARLAEDIAGRQRGGRIAGVNALGSFLQVRGAQYRFGMSSPLSAERVCSRISPHLALGTLSMREVLAALRERKAALRSDTANGPARQAQAQSQPGRFLASLAAFEGRLHWHCHFMQKLESEPSIEFQNMVRGFDGMREPHFNSEYFARWQAGQTGYPLIDACMRKLHHTGWINFRMRAMLVSFAAIPLWLHWRQPGLHLARLFIDFEPGIHWSQMQMQSGTTGINALRVYNPVKQAQDHDPEGVFVRRWLPELAQVPDSWIFQPWLMPAQMQLRSGCVIGKNYPAPVLDAEQASRIAKAQLQSYRRRDETQAGMRQVLVKHGSRKRPAARKGRAKSKPEPVQPQMHFRFDADA
jgi:deoxyribodipyrimidine photo-lyase